MEEGNGEKEELVWVASSSSLLPLPPYLAQCHALRSFRIIVISIRLMPSIVDAGISDLVIYPNREASSSWVCTSNNDPLAIERNRAYSLRESRPLPSAMFDGIDTTARRN